MILTPRNPDLDTTDLDKYPDAHSYFYSWNQPLNEPDAIEGGPLVPNLNAFCVSLDFEKAWI